MSAGRCDPGDLFGGDSSNSESSEASVASLGADLLLPDRFESPIPSVNTDGLSLAPVGGLIETLTGQAPEVKVDIGHLRVEPL